MQTNEAQQNATRDWVGDSEADLTAETLQALFDNEIAAIRIRGFASVAECKAVTDAIREVGMQHVYKFKSADGEQLSDITTGYIGLTHYNYRHKPASTYLAEVPEAIAYRDRVFARSFDAVDRMISHLQAVNDQPVRVAASADGKAPLYAGIIRDASTGGALHADYAPFTVRDLEVRKINAQISWNAWFEHPSVGGETTVHRAPWSPAIDGDEIPEQYPLDRSLVSGAAAYTYRPTPGDAILFNTRNPHEIAPAAAGETHSRLQVGSFIGRLDSGELVLWS